MAKLSGTRAAKTGSEQFKPGELTSIRIVPSSNGGAEVYCEYAPTKAQMKNFGYTPSKPATFTSKAEAIEHARKELGE